MKRVLLRLLTLILFSAAFQSCLDGGEFEEYVDFDQYNFKCTAAYMSVVKPCEQDENLDECQLILCSADINSSEVLMAPGGHLHLTFYSEHSDSPVLPLGEYSLAEEKPQALRFVKGELDARDMYTGSLLTVRTPVVSNPYCFPVIGGTVKVAESSTEGHEISLDSVFITEAGYFTFKYDGNVTYIQKEKQ